MQQQQPNTWLGTYQTVVSSQIEALRIGVQETYQDCAVASSESHVHMLLSLCALGLGWHVCCNVLHFAAAEVAAWHVVVAECVPACGAIVDRGM